MSAARQSVAEEPRLYSAAEYFALVDAQPKEKLELLRGRLLAMAGTREHALVCGELVRLLGNQLEDRECRVVPSELKVVNTAANSYLIPDVAVYCGEMVASESRADVMTNPSVVVEVLSPSTAERDRREKSEVYRAIPSVHTVVLIAQDRAHAEWYERHGSFWKFQEVNGLDAALALETLGVTLSLRDIYRGVSLPEAR